MAYSIRVDRTNAAAFRVQVVHYVHRKPVMVKHVGTAHSEPELAKLKRWAEAWIDAHPPQPQLFALPPEPTLLDDCDYLSTRFNFVHEFLYRLCEHFDFTSLGHSILIDLCIMRIVEPTSKLRSLALLQQYFNIAYTEITLYRHLKQFPALKKSVEEKMVAIAKNEFGFDFSFVLYDVTTLYFETFKVDSFRKPGFSKDNKSQQPQIVVGLMVTPEGLPVSYEVFSGNTFEGKTFLPSILAFKALHHIETLTIVADAAMLSLDNIQKLVENKLTYIVAARLGNIPETLLTTIDTALQRRDGATMKTPTLHGDLVCGYSKKRYHKDLADMMKQIKKAKSHVQTPGTMRRAKFVRADTGTVTLNEALIEKTKKLLGIKGYYTNLRDVSDADIIAHYHSLWHIEQAFRIAKSDLASRPIFHHKEVSIKAHMLICVMALSLSKYIELKTKRSIRSVIDVYKRVTDAVLIHRPTGEIIIKRAPIPTDVGDIEKLMSH